MRTKMILTAVGRDQPGIQQASRMESIAFVDGIAVLVEQERLVEVRAGFDRTFAVIFHPAAPVDDPASSIDCL